MPEREYFSYRHAVPGYTFILILVSINIFPLLRLLGTGASASQVFGAFLAFLSLFTGSALGFLLSQIYWWRFKRKGGFLGIKGMQPVEDLLTEECQKHELKIPEAHKNETLEAISDYIETHVEREKTLEYSARRWDMYHTLGSTLWSLFLGTTVGLGLRAYSELFLFRTWFNLGDLETTLAEWTLMLFVLLSTTFIFLVIWRRGRKRLENEYCLIMAAFTKRKLDRINKNDEVGTDFKEILSLLVSKASDVYENK